jgi:hypothetical protein
MHYIPELNITWLKLALSQQATGVLADFFLVSHVT